MCIRDRIEHFLREELKLEFNPKTTILAAKNGIDFVGYKHRATHRKVRKDSIKRIKRTIKKCESGKITKEQLQKSIQSWTGHAGHADSYNSVSYTHLDVYKRQAVEGMKNVITGITDVFKNIGSTFAGFGKNMVEGIWNGISGATRWIKDKISGWVGNVTDFLKDLFGIASPSKPVSYTHLDVYKRQAF